MITINVMTQDIRNTLKKRRAVERAMAWSKANPDRRRKSQREWDKKNLEVHKRWRKANPDKMRKMINACREAKSEQYKETAKAWRRANPDKVKKQRDKWKNNNPDKVREYVRNRRALEQNAVGSFTFEQFKTLGNICLCCGRNESELAAVGLLLVPDHVIPLALGGSNNISNIQPLCHAGSNGGRGGCNGRKHAKYIDYREETCVELPSYQPAQN